MDILVSQKVPPAVALGIREIAVDLFRSVIIFLLIAESTGLYELLLAPAPGDTALHKLGFKFQHSPWVGVRAWGLGQPMFISDAAVFLSFRNRQTQGIPWKDELLQAVKRGSFSSLWDERSIVSSRWKIIPTRPSFMTFSQNL